MPTSPSLVTVGGSDPDPPTVIVHDVSYRVGTRTVLEGVTFEVSAGQSLSVTGPSGSGKTTLLMCLSGLLTPTSGNITIYGTELSKISSRQRSALRLRRVGLVYQFGELISELTPLENVALPAMMSGIARPLAEERAGELLYALDVADRAYQPTPTLSGGERQRVAVARALVMEPGVILADEPTGSLDRAATEKVAQLLFEVPKRFGCALVVVTHNSAVARQADLISELRDGCLHGVAP